MTSGVAADLVVTQEETQRLIRFMLRATRGEAHYVDHVRQDPDGWWVAVAMCGAEVLAGVEKPSYPLGIAFDPACEGCTDAAFDAAPLSRRAPLPVEPQAR